MFSRMTSVTKFLLAVAIVAGAYFGLRYAGINPFGKKTATAKSETTTVHKSGGLSALFNGNDNMTVILNTWGGYVTIADLNGGSKLPNPDSRITKEFGINLTIKICDKFEDSRNTFKAGEGDVLYCTADAWPVDMGYGSGMASLKAKFFGQHDWSRGGDMIVVTSNIKTAADLKGKQIAVAEGTASNSFLIKFLESSGLKMSDVVLVKVSDGIEAANLFKAGTVPAAVCWTPDGEDIVDQFKGKARILVGTDKAPFIIADGWVATEDYIAKNKDLLVKFMTAVLTVNGELNNASDTRKREAATNFAKVFFDGSTKESDISFGLNGLSKVRLTTLGDNLNFFGENSTYTGVTGEQLYNKMSIVYSGLGVTSKPLAWRNVSTTEIISAVQLTGANQDAEAAVKFSAPTPELKTKVALSSKKLSINFETGSALLSDDAKALIDQQVIGNAKDFAGLRLRVEGNTDAVGNVSMNLTLSFQRAQAVVDYIVKEAQFDPNRFIVIGNGSKQAIAAGVTGANEAYRRTDFQFVEE